MRKPIRRAAVIGAGVMGSGIAAHLANAGVEVLLIDIVPPNLKDDETKQRSARDRFAASGLDKAIKARPAAFFQKDRARLVSIGNVADGYLYNMLRWTTFTGVDLTRWPALQAFFARVEARPAVQAALAAEKG